MKVAIRKHFRDFLAIAGLALVGLGVAVYILSQQDFRFPLVEATPKKIEIELANAQAVQPGQGQTVRVAGVEVGRIADVQVEDGVAVVTLEIKQEYDKLIRRDATALLRPKTALKDMFVEVDPGRGKPVPEGGRITVANSLPGHRPGRDLLRARRRHASLPEAPRGRSGQGPRRARRRPPRGVPPLRADPPRPRAGDACKRPAARRAEGAHPRLRPPDDRGRQPPAGAAPACDRVAQCLRRARERGGGDLRVRGAPALLAAGLRAGSGERARVRPGAALVAPVAARADRQARRDE